MLILSRRVGESLTIGDEVVVTVIGVSGNQIRLGIAAPRHIRVLREEIYKAIREENQAAASVPDAKRKLADAFKHLGRHKEGSPNE
jgi:carbon storage regulator